MVADGGDGVAATEMFFCKSEGFWGFWCFTWDSRWWFYLGLPRKMRENTSKTRSYEKSLKKIITLICLIILLASTCRLRTKNSAPNFILRLVKLKTRQNYLSSYHFCFCWCSTRSLAFPAHFWRSPSSKPPWDFRPTIKNVDRSQCQVVPRLSHFEGIIVSVLRVQLQLATGAPLSQRALYPTFAQWLVWLFTLSWSVWCT